MSFPVDEKLPGTYFLEIMNAQVIMVKTYFDDLDNPLIFSPYCGNMWQLSSSILTPLMMPLPYYIIPSLIWKTYKTSYTTSGCNLFTY